MLGVINSVPKRQLIHFNVEYVCLHVLKYLYVLKYIIKRIVINWRSVGEMKKSYV